MGFGGEGEGEGEGEVEGREQRQLGSSQVEESKWVGKIGSTTEIKGVISIIKEYNVFDLYDPNKTHVN